jgi:hypothetical protein
MSKINPAKLLEHGQPRLALLILAKACLNMERFDDMCEVMRQMAALAISQGVEFNPEERNLFSIAFKNHAGQLRSAFRAVWTDDDQVPTVNHYQKHLQDLLAVFCTTSLQLFGTIQKIPKLSPESTVFVLKLQADFQRYLAEIDESKEAAWGTRAAELYRDALEIAEQKLEPTDPLRLGVALNYCVCLQEVLKDSKQACHLAKIAFNQSIAKLDEVEEDKYKACTTLMQLLRDNLALWTVEPST